MCHKTSTLSMNTKQNNISLTIDEGTYSIISSIRHKGYLGETLKKLNKISYEHKRDNYLI